MTAVVRGGSHCRGQTVGFFPARREPPSPFAVLAGRCWSSAVVRAANALPASGGAARGRPPCRAARSGCRTSATARRTGSRCSHGQPSSMPRRVRDPALERVEAALGDPDPARMAVVDEDRRRPVWKWTLVESPPMSQRSHIAQSGSSAIIACSAAWSVAEQRGIRSSPSSSSRLGQEPDRLGLEVVARQVERDEVDRSAVADRLALVARPPARSPTRGRRRARGRAAAPSRAARSIAVVGLLLRLRVQSPRNGLDERRPASRSSARTR